MMSVNRKIKSGIVFAIALSLLCLGTSAQQNKFRYRADVTTIDSTGVYKIWLDPKFVADCASRGLLDIRLTDENGNFTAFSVMEALPEENRVSFTPFPEIKQDDANSTKTVFIADATSAGRINKLWLTFKNTAVSRQANLSGSDDLKHWFAIKEDIDLQGADDGKNPEYEYALNFPTSKYRYYKVAINNKKRDPIKIVRSGIYTSSAERMVRPIATFKAAIMPGKKQTSYVMDLSDDYYMSGLRLNIASPKYYDRTISIYDVGHQPEELLYSGQISSSGADMVPCVGKTSRLRLEIINGDDKALDIRDITAFDLKRYAIAYLEKGHKYYILTGNATAQVPSYDLSFLHSKPMTEFPVIRHSAIYKNPVFGVAIIPVARNYTPYIWAALVAVLIVLGLLTWRMVKELNTKQGN